MQHAYLSLGDKEEKTKTKIMSTISKDILQQEELLKQRNINCKMEWNEGNHFQDNGIRTAKGFVWLIDNALQKDFTKSKLARLVFRNKTS